MKILLPLAVLIVVALGCDSSSSDRKPTGQTNSNTPTAQVKAPANDTERLQEAKDIMNRPTVETGDLDDADLYLKAINAKSPEAKEVKGLLKRSADRRKNLEAGTLEAKKILRKAIIQQLEKNFLEKGMDVYFSFEGKNQDVLRMKYVLMSRPLVYQIQNQTDFMSNISELGVKKIIFTDGYDESWSFNL